MTDCRKRFYINELTDIKDTQTRYTDVIILKRNIGLTKNIKDDECLIQSRVLATTLPTVHVDLDIVLLLARCFNLGTNIITSLFDNQDS